MSLKVAFEEDLIEVLDVLAKHPVLNIKIRYDGDVTDEMEKKCRKFMVKYFNRNIEIEHDGAILLTNIIGKDETMDVNGDTIEDLGHYYGEE